MLKFNFSHISLWKRIWILLSVLFFIWLEFFALYKSENESILFNLFVIGPVISAIISAVIFIICLLANWVIEGFSGNEIGSFTKFLIKIFIVAISVTIIYFIASPYQNCLRNIEGSSGRFCFINTSW